MKRHLRRIPVFLTLVVAVAACVSPRATGEAPPASLDQVSTSVAMTLQALAPEESGRPAGLSDAAANLLPHSLYFLANDNQGIKQIYRMERDGRTTTQLTFEPVNVWEYDVSPVDGSLAYETNNQLVLVNADGSNRRVLVAGVSNPDAHGVYHPVFSPDGQTLAYAHQGLNLYSVSTGLSSLVIQDQFNDIGNGQQLPVETYAPERYSPDGTKLLLALGHWEVAPSHAVYDPATNTLVRYTEVQDYIYCCSFHGGPAWSPDSSSFYGVASAHDFAYKSGEVWKVDAADGALTRQLQANDGTMNLPKELHVAPDGQLYFFLGTYHNASGFFDAPVLELVRAAPDRLADRTVLREENFVLMNEALWAPDASFVIVAMSLGRDWDQEGGVLELYYTDKKKGNVWLASFGEQMRWGP
jgi:hypothetical protein